ncbi:MAG: hypothetical protein ACTSQE_02240 [Candidatus Heimdallarchaeaceae archaeon]
MSRNLILLTLLKHAGYISGRVQLQKLIFLLENNYGLETGYKFIAFKYGPYCQAIQEDLEYLIEYGYVYHKEEQIDEKETVHKYQITEYGEQYLLENEVPELYDQVIQDLCLDFKNYSLRQLIEYVYENYPEYIVKSKVKDKYYKPQPQLEDFTPANAILQKKPIIPVNFVKWLDEEIEETKNRLGVEDQIKTEEKEFEIDELVISMLEIAYEDIAIKAQEISTNIMLEDYEESGGINNQIYFILEIIECLLSALEEGDLIGICTEFTNAKTNVRMLEGKVSLYKTSLKSELVREINEFIDDIYYLLNSTDKILSL